MDAFPVEWTVAVMALALHVVDEAAHDFLSWYNPIARRIRARLGGLPFPPTFTLASWSIALTAAVLALAALTPAAIADRVWMRPLGYTLAAIHIGNGTLHVAAGAVARQRVPGILSAPLLIAAGVWLWLSVARLA